MLDHIRQSLDTVAAKHRTRVLRPAHLLPGGRLVRDGRELLDFASNDYLGLALHPLLARLAPEPFDPTFDADYLWRATRGRRVAIKLLIMNSRAVVGVGNIYASEALFRAGIRPRRQARSLKRDEVARLVAAIREVLAMAIEVGGTTLRDYVGADGNPGYFRQQLFVYERPGEACRVCGTPVRHAVLGQRATYWCPQCQH